MAVPLLAGRFAELSLRVAKPGDRFHRDGCSASGQEEVECAHVAGNVEGRLELPAPRVPDTDSKAAQQVELGGIAQA